MMRSPLKHRQSDPGSQTIVLGGSDPKR